ncbi:hypothetical protein QTH87_21365 [Variovorax sp. J22P168]|uniref:hypothetical protein n=1 Tax=Variovorax jilinensis TaxID=3053513 RepID=UPI0025788C00|nr:hypothetical protein [Variovorax sp. J22P168]MDM0015009.1 hypothetical protein [Variovorax sp. J22P168]
MNRIALPLALVVLGLLSACGAPSHEVLRMRDGSMRAGTSAEAAEYCRQNGGRVQVTGKAPAESGVFFRCDR